MTTSETRAHGPRRGSPRSGSLTSTAIRPGGPTGSLRACRVRAETPMSRESRTLPSVMFTRADSTSVWAMCAIQSAGMGGSCWSSLMLIVLCSSSSTLTRWPVILRPSRGSDGLCSSDLQAERPSGGDARLPQRSKKAPAPESVGRARSRTRRGARARLRVTNSRMVRIWPRRGRVPRRVARPALRRSVVRPAGWACPTINRPRVGHSRGRRGPREGKNREPWHRPERYNATVSCVGGLTFLSRRSRS